MSETTNETIGRAAADAMKAIEALQTVHKASAIPGIIWAMADQVVPCGSGDLLRSLCAKIIDEVEGLHHRDGATVQ